ncbi:MAG: hypothetical protein ACI89U_002458 [Gammaproteobacteria bacterium]|jgi:hypothetical protein
MSTLTNPIRQKLPAKLINGAFCQVGWFVCLFGGDIAALLFLVLTLFFHQHFIVEKSGEWLLIAAVTILGFVLDSTLTVAGFFQFEVASLSFIPLWLVCLWCIFATTLCHSMSWFHERLWLASLMGGLAGASSYFAGHRLGAVSIAEPLSQSLFTVGLCWAVLFPTFIYFSRKVIR